MLPGLLSIIVGAVLSVGLTPSTTPDPTAAEPPVPPALERGDSGTWVTELNERLADLGFRPDQGDVFGDGTEHAVIAFQKHHGLERDGRFAGLEWTLLDDSVTVPYRAEQDRVEVDLGKQVLYLVHDHTVEAVIPISSGNGEAYRNGSGSLVRAATPEGRFSFQRRIEGMRISYLGALYNPFYFRGGYAIHGSPSVPAWPASHGCVRVTYDDMDYLKAEFEVGMPVLIYGLRTEAPPVEVAEKPVFRPV